MSAEKKYISNQQLIDWSKEVVGKIKDDDFKPDLMIGLNRGGLVPLAYISYGLNLRNNVLLDISFYEEDDKINAQKEDLGQVMYQLENMPHLKKAQNVLIVDDLVDSGHTVRVIKKLFTKIYPDKNLKIAVLYQNSDVNEYEIADYYAFIEEKKNWLVFPWDTI